MKALQRQRKGMLLTFANRAKDEGMNIAVHWQDDDSSSGKGFLGAFPDCIMLCGGQCCTRSGETCLKNKRRFTANGSLKN